MLEVEDTLEEKPGAIVEKPEAIEEKPEIVKKEDIHFRRTKSIVEEVDPRQK